jgi:hypothetical protein
LQKRLRTPSLSDRPRSAHFFRTFLTSHSSTSPSTASPPAVSCSSCTTLRSQRRLPTSASSRRGSTGSGTPGAGSTASFRRCAIVSFSL